MRNLAVLILASATFVAPLAAQILSYSDRTVEAGLICTHSPPGGLPTSPMLSGGGVGDFDGDGWLDLFVVMGGGAPDALFINDGDGTFTERAEEWGVDAMHIGGGVAVGDYDNDGDVDLYVASHGSAPILGPGAHKLYRNDGGLFTDVAAAAGVATASPSASDGFGAAFGDMDLDGDLDLFVAGWVGLSDGNRLFRNDGDGTFTDVTATAIDVSLADVRGFSPHFIDMNGDRWPELLIAGDFFTSRYLVNDGDGTFTDQTASSGTGLDSNGMGQTVADLDGDLLLDWYVTSIFHDGGLGHSGNMLYMAQGGDVFVESSVAAGVNDGGWGWGTVAVDMDHDGWVDLVETNGWVAGSNPPQWQDEQIYLWINDGDATFTEGALEAGIDYGDYGRGLLHFDADNDGDQDLAAFAVGGPLVYYRNDLLGPDAHWLRVLLDDGGVFGVAPDGYGARVLVTAGGVTRLRAVSGNSAYLTQSELSAHVGLGAATLVDELVVEWPNGTVRTLVDLAVDQTLTVTCCAGWTGLGDGLAGLHGVPTLAGSGTLVGGDAFSLELANALESSSASLVVGLSTLQAPFKGGVMVPDIDVLIPWGTDASGGALIAGAWPGALPAGTTIWLQAWVGDPAGPFGYAASNAVSAITP